ncbi:MAG: alanine dehydrogenase, partial [Bacteriovoracaceae bacterium]
MKIAVPREIKNNENRVGLVPGGVRQLIQDGHEVYIQKDAGAGIGISDEMYTEVGAKITPTLEETFAAGELIIKVKEPQPEEIALLRPHHILYTYL